LIPIRIETADGTSLFCRDHGRGRPVVFLCAWALNSDFWEYQISYCSERNVRCIGYDRRGHGRSGQPGIGYDFDTLADDLATVIEQLDLHDVLLVGHAMGCGEVIRYLSRHGARRISRAVLISTFTPFALKTADNPDGADPKGLEAGRAALGRDRQGAIATGAAAFFGPKNQVSNEVVKWWTRQILQSSLKAMLDLHRVYTATDFRTELRSLSLPTLVIHGDSDVFSPIELTARRTSALIPSSQLKVYEGAAHGLPITHADRLNADLPELARA
jgi:pimeloyl-ACP methyl ester carboxylesterase